MEEQSWCKKFISIWLEYECGEIDLMLEHCFRFGSMLFFMTGLIRFYIQFANKYEIGSKHKWIKKRKHLYIVLKPKKDF